MRGWGTADCALPEMPATAPESDAGDGPVAPGPVARAPDGTPLPPAEQAALDAILGQLLTAGHVVAAARLATAMSYASVAVTVVAAALQLAQVRLPLCVCVCLQEPLFLACTCLLARMHG